MRRNARAYKEFVINCFYRHDTDPLFKVHILEEARERLLPEELDQVGSAINDLLSEGILRPVRGRPLYELVG